MLEGLHVLPDINLNTIFQYGRLVSHLKEDMLLPQPVDQNIDEPPEILPPTIAKFLALAQGIPAEPSYIPNMHLISCFVYCIT